MPASTEPALERRIVTILFADLVGFTALSETFDPEDVATVQETYFAAVRETIGRYGGRLEKFIGDAAMAVFGIPRARDDDAERAVRAGLALASAVEQVGARLGVEGPDLHLRVGVNTGEVVVGGPDALATGDPVNVAARLQAAAAPGRVLIGETTALAIEDAVELEALEPVALKGKSEHVRVWSAIAVRPERSRDHAMGRLHAPMLGRAEDLGVLEQALANGIGRVVLVAPPGVGKTRLTDEFTRAQDATVLRSRLRLDILAPYHPVGQLVTAALLAADVPLEETEARSEIRKRLRTSSARADVVAGALASVVWPAPSGDERAQSRAVDRDALFEAWLDGLGALATGKKTIWLVEDVHWSGGDLLAFLDLAGRRGGQFVLATARPSLLEDAETWCAARSDVVLHHLPSLSRPDAGDLVRALVGGALGDDVVGAIAARSDGNALFIEELLRTWISVGTLVAEDDSFRLAVDPADIPLPATVQGIYAAQIDDLQPAARQVARRAAVAGRRFPAGALGPLEVDDPGAGIEVLERRALVAQGPTDALLGETHLFRHALLRDAGYASLARSDRARLHIALAGWIEETVGGHWANVAEVIGRHYAAALDAAPRFATELSPGIDAPEAARRAASWFERAAGTALELAAHDAARALLRRALDLTGADAALDRARRLALLGEATAFAADMEEGAQAMKAALELYRESGDRAGISSAGHALGMIWLQQLRFADALELAEELLAELGDDESPEAGLVLTLRAGARYSLTNDAPLSQQDTEQALRIARQAGDESLELAALQWTVGFHSPEPRQLEAVDIDRIVELAGLKGRWATVCTAHEARALLLVMTDRANEATAAITEMEAVASAHGATEALAWADYLRCEQGLASGDWDAGLAAGLRALDLADRNAYARVAIRTWMPLSALAHARGDGEVISRLHEWLVPREALLSRVPSPFARLMFRAMALRLADAGLQVAALTNEDSLAPTFAVPFRQPGWYAGAETVFNSFLEGHALDEAATALETYADRNREWSSAMSLGFEHLLRARLGWTRGGPVDDASRALELFRDAGAPWWEVKALRMLRRDAEADPIAERLGLAGAD